MKGRKGRSESVLVEKKKWDAEDQENSMRKISPIKRSWGVKER